jgi:hypothetical protein
MVPQTLTVGEDLPSIYRCEGPHGSRKEKQLSISGELLQVVVHQHESAIGSIVRSLGSVIPIGEDLACVPDMSACFHGYHTGDIVELIPPDQGNERPRAGRVLYREHEAATRVWYDHEEQYWRLKAVIEHLGGVVDISGPPGREGLKAIDVAYPERVDARKVAEALGLRTKP